MKLVLGSEVTNALGDNLNVCVCVHVCTPRADAELYSLIALHFHLEEIANLV